MENIILDGVSFNMNYVSEFATELDFTSAVHDSTRQAWAEIWAIDSTEVDKKLKFVYSQLNREASDKKSVKGKGL